MIDVAAVNNGALPPFSPVLPPPGMGEDAAECPLVGWVSTSGFGVGFYVPSPPPKKRKHRPGGGGG